MFIDLLTF